MKKFTIFAIILLSFLLISSSLLLAEGDRGEKFGGTLIQVIRESPDNLNPQKTSRTYSNMVFAHVMEPLVIWDDDLEIVGLLAKNWETDDYLTWTFNLKKGINFHNGEPFTAEAVAFTYSDEMFFSDSNPMKYVLSNVKEVNVVDKYTVEFVLKDKSPLFPTKLASSHAAIFPPEATKKYGDEFGTQVLIGTGPYKLDDWKHGQEVILKRYEDYNHGPNFLRSGPAYIEEKIFRVIPEATTRISSLISGDGDITLSVDPKFIPKLKKAKNVEVSIKPYFGVQFMHFNQENEILQDKKVRQAIAHKVNKEQILEVAWDGYGFIAKGLFPDTTKGYDPAVKDSAYEFNPEKAKDLLEEAGWVDEDGDGVREKDNRKLELNLITFAKLDQWSTAAEMIKPMLEDIGFKINLHFYEVGAAYEIMETRGKKYDIGITKIAWYTGAEYLNFICSCGASMNYPGYCDDKLDSLIKTALLGGSTQEREEALLGAHKLAIESAVWVPLIIRTKRIGYDSTRVGGVDALLEHPWGTTREIPQALRLYIKDN